MFVPWPPSTMEAPITQDCFTLNDTTIVTDCEGLDANTSWRTPSPDGEPSWNETSMQLPPGHVYFDYPEEMLEPWVMNEYFFFIVVTYLVTFAIGVSGNLVVISVMAGDKSSRNVTSVFLVSLAVSDLLLLTICAPLDVAQYLVVRWDASGTVCKLAAYAETVSAFASVLNMVAVTLERFVVIVFPIHSRTVCTMSNCKRLMWGVWLVSLVVALPMLFVKNVIQTTFTNYRVNVTIYRCKDEHDWQGQSVSWYRLVTLFALPSVVMIVCYSWVILELWVSTKTMDQLTQSAKFSYQCQAPTTPRLGSLPSPAQQQPNCRLILRGHANSDIRDVKRARQQVIKMLILVVILFLLCWGPRLIMEIVIKCCLNVFNHGVYAVRVLFYLLPFVHSCLNPIVYCFMSSKFRRRMVRCCHRTCFAPRCRVKSATTNNRCSSRNGTTRLGSTYTFTSYATSTVAIPSSMTQVPGDPLAL
ncbi:cholecystokinin receptor type A-like [Dermacentor albipictus]|uniref:cholecystokinin receptor type A-like n=1 Tax=Dermacentor albipictus TaxID=60249 RepID=UPI0031FDD02E